MGVFLENVHGISLAADIASLEESVGPTVFAEMFLLLDLFAAGAFFTFLAMLRSVTTKGNPLSSHGCKEECPIGEEAYKILYPLGGRPTPSGCTGIDQSEEWDPSNITLYG